MDNNKLDTAVYYAMVRMAQDFSTRGHLVDLVMGNFGSVDGDSPAAMRYKAKMSRLSFIIKRYR